MSAVCGRAPGIGFTRRPLGLRASSTTELRHRASGACKRSFDSTLPSTPPVVTQGSKRFWPLHNQLFKAKQVSKRGPSLVAKAAAVTVTDAEPAPTWQGAKPVPMAITIAVGLVLRYLVPIPEGIVPEAWTLLSIFLSTITGLVVAPLPTGAVAFIALTVSVLTNTLTFAQATAAMTSEVIWLIVVSFFFAKGFELTGLGQRVALLFVKVFGGSTLGLSYGLNLAEGIVSPAMPSTTARAGGIFMPIMKSVSENASSMPGDDSRLRLGAFLAHSQFQTSSHTSALFLTAAAQNLLCLKLASDVIGPISNTFATWMMGGLLPAAVGVVLTPLLIFKLIPPELKETPEAPQEASKQLEEKGPMTRDEIIMMGTMLFAVALWIGGEAIGVSPVLAAMMGLVILLTTGVLKWQQCLEYSPAWDTFFWFAVLIGLSGQLNEMGLINLFSDKCGSLLASLNMGWQPVFVILHGVFFFIHYLFASQTAHVGALYTAFLTLMVTAGAPPLLAALSLAYNTNLFGSITQFASGQAAVYYGAGFMSLKEVFKIGAICAVFNLVVWGVVGGAWWKIIGWW
ncbi:hypothetical protein BSKO_06281 [Bryopsis sp. KO-2023]|nr:hypothetical protein BSKO_06281 [Bryopsis sp. KO-2023]